jgi:hypothetical protein
MYRKIYTDSEHKRLLKLSVATELIHARITIKLQQKFFMSIAGPTCFAPKGHLQGIFSFICTVSHLKFYNTILSISRQVIVALVRCA